jgi:hypothetical protein
LKLDMAKKPKLDAEFEEATEGEEEARKHKLKRSGRPWKHWSGPRSV